MFGSAVESVRRSYLIKVVLSEHNLSSKEGVEQVFGVSRALVHYMYNYRTFDSDIMLLKVSSSSMKYINIAHMLISLMFVYPSILVRK